MSRCDCEGCRMVRGEPPPPAADMLTCDIAPRQLAYPLRDYHRAMLEGPLHYTWTDKPHRLVYDLIAAVRYYAATGEQAECLARACAADVQPAEAVTGFAAWLTCRRDAAFTTFHDAALMAQLVEDYRLSQGWQVPREDFASRLKCGPQDAPKGGQR